MCRSNQLLKIVMLSLSLLASGCVIGDHHAHSHIPPDHHDNHYHHDAHNDVHHDFHHDEHHH